MSDSVYTSAVFVGKKFKNQQVMQVLEKCLADKIRIRVWYGDTLSGIAWAEENDVLGRVGRSTGQVKIPLLVATGENGGGGILQDCIVRIDTTKGKTLYQHQTFSVGFWQVTGSELFQNGEVWGRFKTANAAIRCMEFMQGKRYAK